MKKTALFFIVLLLFSAPVFASEPPGGTFDLDAGLDKVGAGELLENLPPEAREFADEMGGDLKISDLITLPPEKFFDGILSIAKNSLKKPVITFMTSMAVIMICAIAESFRAGMGGEESATVFSLVGTLAVAGTVLPVVVSCVEATRETIGTFATFIFSYIPILTGVIAASGKPLSASTYNMFVFMGCQMAAGFITTVVLPLIFAYLALCIVGSVMPKVDLEPISSGIKSAVTWVLGLLLSLFVGVMSVQSIVAGAGDSATSKAAKFVIGSFVPVAGGAISDAFSAAQGCINLLRTSLGGFGVIIAAVTFLPLILRIVGIMLAFNVSAAAAKVLGVKGVNSLLKSVASATAILLSVVLAFGLLVIITTTVMLLVGGV